jgi:hypothetical protein
MISQNIHIALPCTGFNQRDLGKGAWLAILHAQRIPPHIGMILNGNYNSLTIKGREMNLQCGLLVKAIERNKIKSAFIRLADHPVFSTGHQLEIFQEQLKKFDAVKQNEATCLTPVKLFFNEFYAIDSPETELFYDFLHQLSQNKFIHSASAIHMSLNNGIELPFYTLEQLNEKITHERQTYLSD